MDSDLHHHHGSHQQQHQQQNYMINSIMYSDSRIRLNESHFINSTKQQQMMYQEIIHNNNSIVASSGSAAREPATNLLRQSSSPAGFFEHVNMNNGYSIMGSLDKSGHANYRSVPDSWFSPRLKTPMDFSSGSHSSSRLASSIPVDYESSLLLTDGFVKETDRISSCEIRNEGKIHGPTGLTHQLSLPTSSTKLSAMENLLQFQDNVPLRSRAKRGCATHPRSIAERMRRTRISERMKKLQDLVPNMDKQTSIADMLDLAVDYIKNLQKHVETLADHHAKCRCPNKKKL